MHRLMVARTSSIPVVVSKHSGGPLDEGQVEPFGLPVLLRTVGRGGYLIYAEPTAHFLEELRHKLTVTVDQNVRRNSVQIYLVIPESLCHAIVDFTEIAGQNFVKRSVIKKVY